VKITGFKQLHADFGWRTQSFLKVETSSGIVGWTEYYEGAGNLGLNALVAGHLERLIGQDPRDIEPIISALNSKTLQAPGGLAQQAIGTISNALLDIKGKDLNVPVYALYGGAIHKRIPVYCSHFASYRTRWPQFMGVPAPKTLDDYSRVSEEYAKKGFKAFKTTTLMPKDGGGFTNYRPTSGESSGFPALNLNPKFVEGVYQVLKAMKDGAGPNVGLALDANLYFKPEGFRQLAFALEPLNLFWLEIDNHDPEALAFVRSQTRIPIASLEHSYRRSEYRHFLDKQAVDVAIIDPIWNGFVESLKIANLCETYEINIAPHNYYGYMSDFISASLATLCPNLRIMETDVESVPWRHEFYTHAPEFIDGEMVLPTRPGWGTDINEAAVLKRPSQVGKHIAGL
jgi:L-alanine-DL-glutamate epimerase-like enolase superfamily enzyme